METIGLFLVRKMTNARKCIRNPRLSLNNRSWLWAHKNFLQAYASSTLIHHIACPLTVKRCWNLSSWPSRNNSSSTPLSSYYFSLAPRRMTNRLWILSRPVWGSVRDDIHALPLLLRQFSDAFMIQLLASCSVSSILYNSHRVGQSFYLHQLNTLTA